MGHQTASGVEIGISLVLPATHTVAACDALTFATVGEVTNVGEFGKEWATVTHNPLNTRGTKKGKGSFNNGMINPTVALDPEDAGQTAMETALESDADVMLYVKLQDGTLYYFRGLVMAFKPNIGTVDAVVTASTKFEIQPDAILKKDAP